MGRGVLNSIFFLLNIGLVAGCSTVFTREGIEQCQTDWHLRLQAESYVSRIPPDHQHIWVTIGRIRWLFLINYEGVQFMRTRVMRTTHYRSANTSDNHLEVRHCFGATPFSSCCQELQTYRNLKFMGGEPEHAVWWVRRESRDLTHQTACSGSPFIDLKIPIGLLPLIT